jgi:hypothetical protein
MSASQPYRTPAEHVAPARDGSADSLRRAQSVAKLFLFGWSLARVGVCSVRGLDVEGFMALTVVVAVVTSVANHWSRFS